MVTIEIHNNIKKLVESRGCLERYGSLFTYSTNQSVNKYERVNPNNLKNYNTLSMRYSDEQLLLFLRERILEAYPEYKGIGIKLVMSENTLEYNYKNNFKDVAVVEL